MRTTKVLMLVQPIFSQAEPAVAVFSTKHPTPKPFWISFLRTLFTTQTMKRFKQFELIHTNDWYFCCFFCTYGINNFYWKKRFCWRFSTKSTWFDLKKGNFTTIFRFFHCKKLVQIEEMFKWTTQKWQTFVRWTWLWLIWTELNRWYPTDNRLMCHSNLFETHTYTNKRIGLLAIAYYSSY